jgi:hypothetical protein
MKRILVCAVALAAACRPPAPPAPSPKAPAAGELTGIVVLDGSAGTATPVGGADVTIANSALVTRSDASGAFTLRGLPAGKYALHITASSAGTDAGARIDVTMPAGAGVDLGRIVIGAAGGVTGSVTLDGKPVDGASAFIVGLAQAPVAAGTYTFANLVPGTYGVSVLATTADGSRLSKAVSRRR